MARQPDLRPEQTQPVLNDIASARSEEDMLFENIDSDIEPMSSSNELEEIAYEHVQHEDKGLTSRNKRSFKADNESSVPSKVPRSDTGAHRSSNTDEVSYAVPEKSTNEQGVMGLLEDIATLNLWDETNECDCEHNGRKRQRWSCACGECTDCAGGSKQRTRVHERALRKAVEGGDAAAVAAILLCACADPFFWQEKRLKHALMAVRTAAVAQVFACAAPVFFWQKGYGAAALLRAAKEGREDAVRALLAAGVAADAALPGKAKALRIACCRGHSACVQALLEFGADPNQTVRGNMKPLHLAVCGGDMESVQALLRWGADVGGVGKRGDTPLHYAAGNGYLDFVRVLLDAGADPNTHGDRGYTALHLLAGADLTVYFPSGYDFTRDLPEADKLQCMQLLISRGVYVSATDDDGYTPLFWAVKTGKAEIVKILQLYGVDYTNSEGATVLHMVAKGYGRTCWELFENQGLDANALNSHGNSPLLVAAWIGSDNIDAVKFLLRLGADPSLRDPEGYTALHRAAERGATSQVKELMRAGADPEWTTSEGVNALHLAAKSGSRDCVASFLERGIDVNVPTADGKTPIHFAAGNRNSNCLEQLLEKGAYLQARDNAGWNALHSAAASRKIENVKFLLKHGFTLNDKTSDGRTPLHLAARSVWFDDRWFVYHLTREFHAPVNARDDTGNTPLHVAAQANNESIVRALLEEGAERLAQDDNGDTPADVATEDSVKLLIQNWALAA